MRQKVLASGLLNRRCEVLRKKRRLCGFNARGRARANTPARALSEATRCSMTSAQAGRSLIVGGFGLGQWTHCMKLGQGQVSRRRGLQSVRDDRHGSDIPHPDVVPPPRGGSTFDMPDTSTPAQPLAFRAAVFLSLTDVKMVRYRTAESRPSGNIVVPGAGVEPARCLRSPGF